jgi:hypothetical protein
MKGVAVAAASVTVEISGVTGPATFSNLRAAVDALWQSLRVLPLGWNQYQAYRLMFEGPDAVERVADFLARDGSLQLTFVMAGEIHSVSVRPAEKAVR